MYLNVTTIYSRTDGISVSELLCDMHKDEKVPHLRSQPDIISVERVKLDKADSLLTECQSEIYGIIKAYEDELGCPETSFRCLTS